MSKGFLPTSGSLASKSPDELLELFEEMANARSMLEMENESLRQSHAQIEAVAHRYESLFRHCSAALLVIKPNSELLFASHQLCALLGMSQEQLVRQPFLHRVHKDDQLRFATHVQEVLGADGPIHCGLRLADEGQEPLHVRLESTSMPSFSGLGQTIQIALFEVGALLERQASFKRLSQRYQSLVQHAPVGVLLLDLEGLIVEDNEIASRLLGQSDLIERPFHGFWLNPEGNDHLDSLLESKTKLPEASVWRRMFGGPKPEPWEGYLFPAFRSHGELLYYVALQSIQLGPFTGVLCVFHDASPLYHQHAKKGEFTSIISHELRTPLTSLIGAIKLLRSGLFMSLTPKAEEMLDIALRNGDRLQNLIDDLLDISKLESSKLELRLQTTQLSPIVHNALQNNLEYANQYDVTWSFRDTHPDLFVTVDPHRLQQVLANLLSNAAKFSSPGEQVEIAIALDEPGKVRLEVRDTGLGIPASFRPYLFKKFSQYDTQTSRDNKGTGLGLYISRRLVESMNGVLDYEPNPDGGSCFFIELPETFPDN